ncbi:MAG: choice-of-anchor D domain-containing protein, partial [Candidatus Marinimicrobia bacterium]|nr:choice-of-anchor D domain-containing protein [Candidatus Neomarinimicrobiota bacterium]
MLKNLRNKLIHFAGLVFALPLIVSAQSHFTPVEPTGLPYHIIINSNSIAGVYNAAQVEIGIFDGALCVGSGTVGINSNQSLDIVAWEGDSSYNLDGFTAGNPISIKLAVVEFGITNVMPATVNYDVGDGNFGTGSYSVASVTGTIEEVPDIEVNPSLLSFGALDLGDTDVRSFMVKNQGAVTLQVNSISVPSGYSISTGTFSVNPDDSLQVWVTFSPNSPTDYSGSLRIYSNDPFQTQINVELTGQGLADLVPEILVTPSSLSFGAVPIGIMESQSFTIRNRGSDVLNIFSVSTNHADISAQYSSFSLNPEEEQLIEVEFTPGSGSISGNVLILHNDPAQGSPFSVPVSGYGYDNQFSPVPETGLPYTILVNHVNLDDHSMPYGSQVGIFDDNLCVGSAVYLGSYPLQVTAWEQDSENALAGFSPGNSISIKVHTTAFDSVTVIDAETNFSVGDGLFGAGSYSVVSLNLESELAPRLFVAPTQLEFPLTITGETSSRQMMIHNLGATDLTITGSDMSNNSFTSNYNSGLINSGDSVAVLVDFSPQQGAWHEGNYSIYSDDPENQTEVISLSGAGVLNGQPIIAVPITNYENGDVAVGDTGLVDIQVFNTGNDTLVITGLSLSNAAFHQPSTPLSIPENSSRTIPVNFTPDSQSWFSTSMVIHSNASNNTELSLNINGFGYEPYFQPVSPTGEQYQIVVTEISDASGYGIEEGDEFGVFDGLQCVGIGVYHGMDSLSISTWKANTDQSLPGYTEGNLIQVKMHLTDDDSVEHVLDVIPEYLSGNGAFGTGVFALTHLEIIDRVTPWEPYSGPVFYVSADSGRNYINNGSFDQPFKTIQHGINAVESADTILVRPGIYVENINFSTKNLVLGSMHL